MSSRGWCYILEEHGLAKGDFDRAQELIAGCRKHGLLPLDIVAEDGARAFDNIQELDSADPEEVAQAVIDHVENAHTWYTPWSFWQEQDVYLQMLVEKVDLKSLFTPVCSEFHIPIANARGWSDINSRADLMRRFAEWDDGRRLVLLYAGDFDPMGLDISRALHENLMDLEHAVQWSPAGVEIDRFGLNYEFILAQELTWIDNLETGSGERLDDSKHPDHHKTYVQDYIACYGARKVEANALVVRPDAGRELCRQAILRYLDEDAPAIYERSLIGARQAMRDAIRHRLGDR